MTAAALTALDVLAIVEFAAKVEKAREIGG